MEKKFVYYGIIEKCEEGGYEVNFTDFDNIFTCGDTMEEAIEMGMEALELTVYDMLLEKEELPKASKPEDIKVKDNQTLVAFKTTKDEMFKKMGTSSVKKTLSIPSYLDELAKEKGINFSQTLQKALEKELGL